MKRIDAPDISFDENGSPFSNVFSDIYFAPTEGLAETHTVFLESNNLPAAWQGLEGNQSDIFTIAETGFGTGLNFLAVYNLFKSAPGPCQHLHFISCERYPLSREQLRTALQPWRAHFPDAVDRLVEVYPLRIPGFHRIWFDTNVTLTLILDDAVKAFQDLDASVDAWFLDGFAPSKNPQMWQSDLYAQMARLSHNGTTLASFTASGDVRRGLEAVGFIIERHKGFGNKRHRIIGRYAQPHKKLSPERPKRVAIIGGGLMGATLTKALQRYDVVCTVFDRNQAHGLNASGNRLGLVNPKIDLGHDDVNDLGNAMYSFALHRLRDTIECDLQSHGSFHAATDPVKRDRHAKMVEQLDWLPDHLQSASADETHAITGIALPYGGLFFRDSVTINTGKLVQHLLADCIVQWDYAVDDLARLHEQHDHVVVASAEAVQHLFPSFAAVLQPMRGQVTYIDAPLAGLKCPIVAGNYCAPLDTETWVTGATFQRQRTDSVPQEQDDHTNLHKLRDLLPNLSNELNVQDHWAQIRYTTPDRRPVMGHADAKTSLATGLGSHGLQYSFLLAEILAAQLTGAPMPVSRDVLKILDLNRYL